MAMIRSATRLLPMTSITQSLERARFLAAPDTPLLPLLRAISRETTLLAGQGVAELAEQGARQRIGSQHDWLQDCLLYTSPSPRDS